MKRELTGRHVLIIAVTGFGIVIAANMTMLVSATGTFPGLVVDNAYIASQGWNARRDAQDALGWEAGVEYRPGTLRISMHDRTARPISGLPLSVTVGRPTTDIADRSFTPQERADGYSIPVTLDPGLWRIEIATTDGPTWRISAELRVREAD